MNNIETFRSSRRGSGGSASRGSSYSGFRSRYSSGSRSGSPYRGSSGSPLYRTSPKKYHKTTPPTRYPTERTMYSTSHTLGGTGGGPYWGWWYSPFTSYLYPIFDIVPIDYNLVEIKSKNTEVQKESGSSNEKNKKEKFIDIKLIYPSNK